MLAVMFSCHSDNGLTEVAHWNAVINCYYIKYKAEKAISQKQFLVTEKWTREILNFLLEMELSKFKFLEISGDSQE